MRDAPGAPGRPLAGFGLVWTVGFLTFASPSLATVVPGLPNDHYHAFADPMVFVLVGLGAGALWRWRTAGAGAGDEPAGEGTSDSHATGLRVGRLAAVVGLCLLVGWNLAHQAPAVNADGGFPAGDRAATRIAAAAGGGPIVLRSLPAFKSTEAYAYPLVRAGVAVRSMAAAAGSDDVRPGETLVLICDEQFAEAIGAPCGGQAEASLVPPGGAGTPILRFEAAPGQVRPVSAPDEAPSPTQVSSFVHVVRIGHLRGHLQPQASAAGHVAALQSRSRDRLGAHHAHLQRP